MARNVRYHPLFDFDVREAADWYDQRSLGLGDSFVDAAHRTTLQIIENPDVYASTELGIRYLRLKRFPYIVLFDVYEDELMLIGVLHTARSIDKWREKRGE